MTVDTAIWFDLDGTLLRFPEYGAVVARACGAVGVDAVDDFREAYDDAFFDHLDALDPEPYRRAAAAGLAAVGSDAAAPEFVAALRDAEYDAMPAPPAVRETLAGLAGEEDVAVGVCTNGVSDWQRGKLRAAGLAEYVDATVVSDEAGAHKPDPAPFERAEAAIDATRRVMIGDGEDADVAGARERGWEAVHVEGPADVPEAVDSVR
ncbi:HAD family hydrolase [Halobaculum magnesiiphilum]|uniref:HAD family hydrolase n=1 Tax=Halobaculum magnesiiphilum TaxID=1017351 RepID=A0A8T8W980_9EURY|nr:HAD family hydrolase [Halobaculum magnesiiphilum]QZP36334.1 HAD family hydrolase [Halobaculum magnesiiphilum]